MELVQGTPYIGVDIRSRSLCAKYGDPEGSFVFFRWDRNQWIRVSRAEYPKGARINLIVNPWGKNKREDATGVVKLADKHLRYGNQSISARIDDVLADRSRDACHLYRKL